MGLFDGFEAGWNSFKNNELKTVTNVALAPNPIVKAISNPKKAIEDPVSLLPVEIGSKGPVVKDAGETWEETGNDAANTLLAPNPIISLVTGNIDDAIPGGKSAGEKWQDVGDTIGDVVIEPIKNETEKITNTITNTYENTIEKTKEVFTNVTKGVSDALPIIAIGGAAVLVVSLLLGRR